MTTSLQLCAKDIVRAYGEVTHVISVLEHTRVDIVATHKAWHEEAVLIGSKVNVEPSIPRQCKRQSNQDNTPAEDSEAYYRRILTIPFLDHLIVEMKSRFSDTQRKAVLGLSLVPSAMENDWKQKSLELAQFYHTDLPDPDSLNVELQLWESKWKQYSGEKPQDPISTLAFADCMLFQNIRELLKILCTLPVTTSECERSNSSLK